MQQQYTVSQGAIRFPIQNAIQASHEGQNSLAAHTVGVNKKLKYRNAPVPYYRYVTTGGTPHSKRSGSAPYRTGAHSRGAQCANVWPKVRFGSVRFGTTSGPVRLARVDELAMVYSEYTKQRILFHYYRGLRSTSIAEELRKEGGKVSVVGVWKFCRRYEEFGTIGRRPGSGRSSKIIPEVEAIVEQQMQLDDETTAVQLHRILTDKGHTISLRTILRARSKLGWTFRGSAYCQLIREANKVKRLQWARDNLSAAVNSTFQDVVWTDERSAQMESHRRHSYRKVGCRPKPKPR